jgi:hypothetical protein
VVRTYPLPPNSRTTIAVDGQAPELASTDVSAVISADQPILVERAMYLTREGQPFAAGSDSAGVPAAATSWFLAEGATGAFFDMFILIANPSSMEAHVEARYLLASGQVFTKTYTVAADSRRTIHVDAEELPGLGRVLASTELSTTLTSLNGAPIVVERTMWFPGPEITPAYWAESHNSPGATAAAPRWVVADGETGGPAAVRTYVLVANPGSTTASVRITLLLESGPSTALTFAVPAHSRRTFDIGGEFQLNAARFATVVESVTDGMTPVAPLVVERAMYWNAGGVVWAAGTNVLGTPIP